MKTFKLAAPPGKVGGGAAQANVRLDFVEQTLVWLTRAVLGDDPMAIAKLASHITVLEAAHNILPEKTDVTPEAPDGL